MKFHSWTISRKLTLLSLMNFTILAAVVGFSNVTIVGLGNLLQKIGTNDIPAIRSMALTDMIHDGLRAAVLRGFVGTYQHNRTQLKEARTEYDQFSQDIEKHIHNIRNLNVDEQTKKQAADSVAEVKVYVASGLKIMELLDAGKIVEAEQLQPEYQKAFESLEAKLEVLGNLIEKETAKSLTSDNERAKHLGYALAAIGCILSLLVPWFLGRNLVSALNGIVLRMDQQKHALEQYTVQIEQSARDLSSSSASQAAAIQESASAIEEISSMVARTAENSRNLATSAHQSDRTADDGRKAAAAMLSEVDQIKVSNADVKAQVEDGNNEIEGIVSVIQEIGEKTKVINDIVFQTKLLSFNASVEAARAGEHGKGFAVVAEEVGNLAQMSGNAAKQITELLEHSTKQVRDIVVRNSEKVAVLLHQNSEKVEHGRQSAENCDSAFGQVASQVSEVRRLTGEITTAIQEQTTGLSEINKSIGLFNESTQENAASAQSASEVAGRLREQFMAVDELMTELGAMIHGSKVA